MDLKLMKKLCQLNEDQLYKILINCLDEKYNKIVVKQEYIMAEGTIPIFLIAHLDTVFKTTPSEDSFIYDQEKQILWSPGGSGFDDRAGVYIILELIMRGYRPHILFTRGEEIGGIGARDLIKDYPNCPYNCHALIQLDRAYNNDCVFYDCDNKDFTKYIESFGFEESWGTFSDISIVAPSWKIAAVNLSVGYVDEHNTCERLYCSCCDETIEKVSKILDAGSDMKHYKYVMRKPQYRFGVSSQSRDPFDPRFCLICGNKIKPASRGLISDEEFPYYVCPSCYKTYYTDVEEIVPFDF